MSEVDSDNEKHNGRRLSVQELVQTASRRLSNSGTSTSTPISWIRLISHSLHYTQHCAGKNDRSLLIVHGRQHISQRTRRFLLACVGLVVFGLLFSGWNRHGRRPSSAPEVELSYNRITKVSMLFGQRSAGAYQRSMDSHRRHAQRWGYNLRVLDRDEGCGFWTKLIYLLSVLGDEMQKSVETRAEWIM